MAKNIKVKPGKSQSIVGVISGLVFVGIGLFIAIPTFGLFGIFWTIIALIITVTNAINAFGSKGVSLYEMSIDDNENALTVEQRLKNLDSLYNQRLITKEEYDRKRQDILDDI